jgi:hypothetical protein
LGFLACHLILARYICCGTTTTACKYIQWYDDRILDTGEGCLKKEENNIEEKARHLSCLRDFRTNINCKP